MMGWRPSGKYTPPAAKTLFEKRVLDSQKLFIKMLFIINNL
jgi:hypothetical protein